MRLEQYLNEGIKSLLKPLADEAKKHDNYEDFEKAFTVQIKRGEYWHVTDNPNFVIDPKKGPRDMSSMASGKMNSGELMVTSHLEYWSDYYGKERPYAVLIDLSKLPLKAYNQVSRGFGNEFYISKSWMSKVKVVKVLPMKKALALSDKITSSGPQSREELREFWNKVKGINEGWFTMAKIKQYRKEVLVEIWVNPSKSELRKIGKNVRFVADSDTKKVYVWGADFLHDIVWDKILKKELKDFRRYDDLSLFKGGAKNGRFDDFENDAYSDMLHDDLAEVFFADPDHWRWVGKYISGLENLIDYTEKYRGDDI